MKTLFLLLDIFPFVKKIRSNRSWSGKKFSEIKENNIFRKWFLKIKSKQSAIDFKDQTETILLIHIQIGQLILDLIITKSRVQFDMVISNWTWWPKYPIYLKSLKQYFKNIPLKILNKCFKDSVKRETYLQIK
jgi:hypothetical protein